MQRLISLITVRDLRKTFQFYTVKSVDEVEKKERIKASKKKKKQNNTGENLGKDMLERSNILDI